MRAAAADHGSEGQEGTSCSFDDGRELELKGLEGTHTVYRVALAAGSRGGLVAASEAPAS